MPMPSRSIAGSVTSPGVGRKPAATVDQSGGAARHRRDGEAAKRPRRADHDEPEHANSHVPSVLASLTKGGLSAATKSLAIEYAKLGIRVNAVAPGVIKTPLHPVETHAQLAKLHPLGRMGEISEIGDAILYLESAVVVACARHYIDHL